MTGYEKFAAAMSRMADEMKQDNDEAECREMQRYSAMNEQRDQAMREPIPNMTDQR